MTLLSEAAALLTREHPRMTVTGDGETVYATEPALLDLLAGCTASDTGRGTAAGVARTGSPVDLGALDLLTEITRTIDAHWPGAGDKAHVRVPHTRKLNAWVTATADPMAEADLYVLVQSWVHRIRELIEPTKRVPVPGVACPTCGWERTATEQDGEWTYRPALVAYPAEQPVRVVCTVETCSAEWTGPDVATTFMPTVDTGSPTR